MLKIAFLGAAETVTGSKYLVTYGSRHFMVDCGLFQGPPENCAHNFDRLPIPARKVEALVLTHAHIDHSGAIPRLSGDGFQGNIYCTEPTRDLCGLMLPDSAKIQEDDAGDEVPPFYTRREAEEALELFEDVHYYQKTQVIPGVTLTFYDAGHIVGSAWAELEFQPLPEWQEERPIRVVFSGDIGRAASPLLGAPDRPRAADFLILESTYGNRLHSHRPPREHLQSVVQEAMQKGSTVIVPAFAVQRCQDLAYLFHELWTERSIGPISLFLDSPMAARATRIFESYPDYLGSQADKLLRKTQQLLRYPYLRVCENAQQSRAIS